MRAAGVRGVLIYCSDYRCSHWTRLDADRWPDDVRLSDIEPLFTCQACGKMGADVRPNFHWEEETRRTTIKAMASLMPDKGWQRRFDEPIPLPRGRQLVTLEDAGE